VRRLVGALASLDAIDNKAPTSRRTPKRHPVRVFVQSRFLWLNNLPAKDLIERESRERMAIVTVNQGESIESALRRFKRKVMTEEIIKDAKKHAFFIPPGQKAKLKSALARKRNKKKGRMRIPRD
jgi:small subunit ribosomal protein S21